MTWKPAEGILRRRRRRRMWSKKIQFSLLSGMRLLDHPGKSSQKSGIQYYVESSVYTGNVGLLNLAETKEKAGCWGEHMCANSHALPVQSCDYVVMTTNLMSFVLKVTQSYLYTESQYLNTS